jgi:hypothetical protein
VFHLTGLERLARGKRPSLVDPFVGCKENVCCENGPWFLDFVLQENSFKNVLLMVQPQQPEDVN